MAEKNIDFSRFTSVAHEEDLRRVDPRRETIPQAVRERVPDYTQRQRERDGESTSSGGAWGGGSVNGRSR